MKNILTIAIFMGLNFALQAQTIQSNGTGGGDWNSAATWAGGVIPNAGNTTSIVIRSNDVVTVPNGFTVQVDQTSVQANATLIIASGGVVEVLATTGADLGLTASSILQVAGRLEVNQGATVNNSSATTTTFQNGGVYRHKYLDGGNILLATWQDGSTVEFTGYTAGTTSPGNLAQSFYNFVWNCTAMTGIRRIDALTTVRGDLTIESTGSTTLHFFSSTTNRTLNITGDLNINGTSLVSLSQTGTGNTINIGGSFNYNSSASAILTQTGTLTLNISGDINQPAGTLRFALYSGAATTVNLSGDVTASRSWTTLSGGVANINFTNSATHFFTSSNAQTGIINCTVLTGNTLDMGTSYISGSGTFTVQSGATLRVGAYTGNGTDGNGAIQSNTSQGNIRNTPSKRTFAGGCTIIYNATDGNQAIGTGHPNSTAIDFEIDNPNTVTVLKNLSAGTITLTQGTLSTGVFNITLRDWVGNGGDHLPGTGTVFFGGASSISGTGPNTFGNLTVNNTATLELPADEVEIRGNLSVVSGGIMNTNDGTLAFTGGNNQTVTVSGNTIDHVSINKSAGTVSLLDAFSLHGVLTIETATTLVSNNNLTVISTDDIPAVDGAIGVLATGASITGNVTVQRYFSAADNYNRYIAAPISNATVAQLQAAFSVTGDFTGTSYPCNGCTNNGASLKYYREYITGAFSKGYQGYPAAGGSNTEVLTPGQGYEIYMWDGVAPSTINFVGTINTGSIALGNSLGHTPSAPVQPSADGWNLVGNPYPSAIQWSNGAGWSKSNIDPTVWVWDVVGRVWHSYNANTSAGDLTNGVIATGQGFWVYAPTPGAASLSINEQAKSSAGAGAYYRKASYPLAKVKLKVNGVSDESYIIQSELATEAYDESLEAYKLQLGMERVSISILDDKLNKFGHYGVAQNFSANLPLALYGEEAGNYEIVIEPGNIQGLTGYYLVDAQDNKTIAIDGSTSYTFSSTGALASTDRFYLTKTLPSVTQVVAETVALTCYPNPIGNDDLKIVVSTGNVRNMRLLDQMGKVVTDISYVSEEGSTFAQVNMGSNKVGVYFIRVLTDRGVLTKKVIKN